MTELAHVGVQWTELIQAGGAVSFSQNSHFSEMQWSEGAVEVQRRMGELLPAITGGKGGGAKKANVVRHGAQSSGALLRDLGITKHQSSRWQKLAAEPDERFERIKARARREDCTKQHRHRQRFTRRRPAPSPWREDQIAGSAGATDAAPKAKGDPGAFPRSPEVHPALGDFIRGQTQGVRAVDGQRLPRARRCSECSRIEHRTTWRVAAAPGQTAWTGGALHESGARAKPGVPVRS